MLFDVRILLVEEENWMLKIVGNEKSETRR